MENWEMILNSMPLPQKGQKVYIWGAGNTAVLSHQGLLREGLYQKLGVCGYLDSGRSGGAVNGFPVMHPSVLDALSSNDVFVLICTANLWMLREIEAVLSEKHISHCLLEAAVMKLRHHRLLEAALLLDDHSRRIYHRLLELRLTLEPLEAELYGGEAYFGLPEFCRSDPRDVVLDCGAYVGDSTERYLWRMEQYQRIIALEPDKGNYQALIRRFARLRAEWNLSDEKLLAVCAGVDERSSLVSVDTRIGGLGSMATEKPGDTVFWAIDDFVNGSLGENPPTFIKADIESFEYRMLLGAKKPFPGTSRVSPSASITTLSICTAFRYCSKS